MIITLFSHRKAFLERNNENLDKIGIEFNEMQNRYQELIHEYNNVWLFINH